MASDTYISYVFANNLGYDLVSDGEMHSWGSLTGRFSSAAPPVTVPAFTTATAFRAQGREDTDTGVTGAVNYWLVSANTPMNADKSNTKGSIQLYFSIAYDHDLYNNKWQTHVNDSNVTMSSTGWSSQGNAVNVVMTFDQAAAK
jgi:hypothetical protein